MRVFVIVLLSGAMLTTPAPAQQYYNENSLLERQVNDYNRTVREGVGLGAVSGAAIGGIVAAVTRQRAPGLSMVVGAGIGALVGGVMGANVAETKQRQTQVEASLDARIVQLRASNAKLSEIVATTDQLIAQRQREITALQRDESGARAQLASLLSKDSQLVQTALSSAIRTRDELGAEVAARSGGSLNRNISRLGQQRRTLDAMGQEL